MNLLGFIFSILLICTCTFSLSTHKCLLSTPIEISCRNHLAASRQIRNSYESEMYNALRSIPKKEKSKNVAAEPTLAAKEEDDDEEQEEKEPISLNSVCSRLNLQPLILNGRDANPLLYEATARIFRSFYQKPLFGKEIRLEYQLLDAMLAAARKEKANSSLEKLLLPDKNVKRLYPLQAIYYRMLKGTKPSAENGYPCLGDYFSIEDAPSSLCLRHASIEMLSALFNPKAAVLIYKEMRKTKHTLSQERVIEICNQSGLANLDDEFFKLLDLKLTRHRLPSKKILVGQEGDVTLRKQVVLPNV